MYFCDLHKGIFYIILSGLCFVIVNFFVKILGAGEQQQIISDIQHYPAHELVLARSIVSFAMSFVIIKYRKIPFWGKNKKWLLVRGLSGTIALTLFFYTFQHMPMAIATIIQYLAPIFTVILALIILKEKVKIIQWFFILLSFAGVGMIALDKYINSEATDFSFFHIGVGMISAVFSGLAYTAVIKLKKTDAPITIVLYFPMIAIPLMTIFCFWSFTTPKGIEWLLLLVLGIFTQFAQIFLTKALHLGSAVTITPFQYLGAIYMFLIGYFVFDEKLSFLVNIGIVFILSGVLLNALFGKKVNGISATKK